MQEVADPHKGHAASWRFPSHIQGTEIVITRQDHDCKLLYKPLITNPMPTITNQSHRLQIGAVRQSLHLVLKIAHQKPRCCPICATLVEIMYNHYANIPIVSANPLCDPE
ncbi:hypothetical protein BDZ94DRAFT_1259008 [Collybia nuda]|uniref:Uncharacterized protein n=1 Tax=Collybia nuda TaxID=64659 RepID=A0A9P5Y6V1_9AGAR|nr:hypothetical protein BDZ94DRAFT_1259008 [Collybia nuda]